MGGSQSQSVPAFNSAAFDLLCRLIEKTENDELNMSKDFFWVYAYQLDHGKPHAYSPHMNIKNDKAIKGLVEHLESRGYIEDVKLVDQPYAPENVERTQPYPKIIQAIGCRVKDMQGLKELRRLMQGLAAKGADGVIVTPASYDAVSAVLSLGETDVRLQADTNQSELCRVLFQSLEAMGKVWNFDEVLDEWIGREEAHQDLKKVYRAARELNVKIAGETGIKDLLVATTKTVQINPAYIVT